MLCEHMRDYKQDSNSNTRPKNEAGNRALTADVREPQNSLLLLEKDTF